MEEKKSIVKSAKATETTNASWKKDDQKVLYLHIIGFENDDIGDYWSQSKEQQFFKVGEETSYTYEVKNGKVKIKPIYASTKGAGGNNHWKQIEVQRPITLRHSYMQAIAYISINALDNIEDKQIAQLADKFYEWCFKGNDDTKVTVDDQLLLNRRSALEVTILKSELSFIKYANSDELLADAEEIFKYITK